MKNGASLRPIYNGIHILEFIYIEYIIYIYLHWIHYYTVLYIYTGYTFLYIIIDVISKKKVVVPNRTDLLLPICRNDLSNFDMPRSFGHIKAPYNMIETWVYIF